MTTNTFKSSKLIVIIASTAFLLGTFFGNQAYSFVKKYVVDNVYANSTAIVNNPINVRVDNNHGGNSLDLDRNKNRKNNKKDHDRNDNNKNKNNNNKNDNNKNDRKNDRNDRKDDRKDGGPDKKIIQKTVVEKQPIVINRGGQTVVERTIENNVVNNNENNNENNNIVEVNPVIENKVETIREVVYETRGGTAVYSAPTVVYKTPDTGAGALSLLTLLPGGAVALFRKRLFV